MCCTLQLFGRRNFYILYIYINKFFVKNEINTIYTVYKNITTHFNNNIELTVFSLFKCLMRFENYLGKGDLLDTCHTQFPAK